MSGQECATAHDMVRPAISTGMRLDEFRRAASTGVSSTTLARRFTAKVGEPPAYLTRWRMDLAAQRLRGTDDTIAAIARSLGYTSEYAFNRAFTRYRHTPPGRYRTQARTTQAS